MLFFFADEPLESETSQPQPESVSAEDSTSAQLNEDKDKIYPCKVCSKVFSRSDSVRRHTKRMHENGQNAGNGNAETEEENWQSSEYSEEEEEEEEDSQTSQRSRSHTSSPARSQQYLYSSHSIPPATPGSYFRPEPMSIPESERYEAFKHYMMTDKAGGGSRSTSIGYAGKMRNFLQHCRNNRGHPDCYFLTLAKVGTASKEDFVTPPSLEPFLDTCISNWVRKYTVCAYIKLLRWLKDDLLQSAMLELPAEEFHRRNWCLDSKVKSSDMLLRSLNKKGNRAACGITATASANAIDSPTLAELEVLAVAYKTSPARMALIEASQNADLFVTKGMMIWERRERSPYYLRNFLMLELLVLNGSRPGAIHNATLAEFEACRLLRDASGYFLSVRHHKSSKSSGNDTLIMKSWLHAAIGQYVRYARPLVLYRSRDSEDRSLPLFPSNRSNAGTAKRSFKDCIGVFFEVARKAPDPRICATSFRSLHVGLGQLSENPSIRSELPSLMGHSMKLAVSTYFRDESKASRRASYQQILLDRAGAVTPPLENLFPDQQELNESEDKPNLAMLAGKGEGVRSEASAPDTLTAAPRLSAPRVPVQHVNWKVLMPWEYRELIWRSFDKDEDGPNLLGSVIDTRCSEITQLKDFYWEIWDKLLKRGGLASTERFWRQKREIHYIIRECNRSRFSLSVCEGWNIAGIVKAFSALEQSTHTREDIVKLLNGSEEFRQTFEGVRHQLAHPEEASFEPSPEELKKAEDYILECYEEHVRVNAADSDRAPPPASTDQNC